VQELSGGSVQANLLLGVGIDEVLQRTETASTSHFLADGLGSTLALTDNTGAVQTEYTYEPFGTTTTSGAASTNATQYTGRENDGTGLYYYRARYYQPGLQRFISEDPIGFRGGDVNLYAYVQNAPMSLVDPGGLGPLDGILRWLGKQAVKQVGKFLGKELGGKGGPLDDSPEQHEMEKDSDQDGTPDFFDPDNNTDDSSNPENNEGGPSPNKDNNGPDPDDPPNNPPDRY
jgi:RHS repeat-associated protein